MTAAAAVPFRRDRLTLLGYFTTSTYAFYFYALGPITGFLRQDLHLSYTVSSLHSTLWAVSALLTGLSFDAMSRRFGRRLLLWAAAATTVVGAVLLLVGYQVVITLMAALVLGAGATLMGSCSSVTLSDRHGEQSDRALVEANAGASVTAVAVPVLLGGLAATAAGWRTGLVVPIIAVAVLYAAYGRVRFPRPSLPSAGGRMPGAFWVLCALVALVVVIEFLIVFFGVPLLTTALHLSTPVASATLSLFFAGELAGRLAGTRIMRTAGRALRVIGIALVMTLASFLVLWWSRITVVSGVALFVAGLGVANLYPLSIHLALAAGGGRTDRAMARTQAALAAAILVAPLLLGTLSDHLGLLRALAVEPALILIAGLVLVAAWPRRRVTPAGGVGGE